MNPKDQPTRCEISFGRINCTNISTDMEELANAVKYSLLSLFRNLFLDDEKILAKTQFLLGCIQEYLWTKWWNFNEFEVDRQESAVKTQCDGGKRLKASDISSVMVDLGMGFATTEEEENGDKGYSEEHFLALFEEDEPSLDEIKETFEVFDVNKDGFIDYGDLQRVFLDLGFREGCDSKGCRRMIKAYDSNGDGLIDFREFVVLMEKSLL